MRAAWGIVVLLAVGSSAEASDPKLEPAMQKLGDSLRAGGSWKDTVDAVVAELGPPRDEAEGKYIWFHLDAPKSCVMFMVHADGEFCDAVDFRSVDDLGTVNVAAEEIELWKICKKGAALPLLAVPKIAAPKTYDLDKPTTAILGALKAGKYKVIYDLSTPKLRKETGDPKSWGSWLGLFTPAAGKLVAPKGAFKYSFEDFKRFAKGDVEFQKGTLTFAAGFKIVDGKPLLDTLNLTMPKELALPQNPADAAKAARKVLDLILADKTAKFIELASTQLQDELNKNPAGVKAVRDYIKKNVGKVKSIKLDRAEGVRRQPVPRLQARDGQGDRHGDGDDDVLDQPVAGRLLQCREGQVAQVFFAASALAVASSSGCVVTGLPVAAFIHASGRIDPSLQMRSNSFANVALSLPATCSSTWNAIRWPST